MKIIAYHNKSNIDIEFEDGTVVYHKRYDRFIHGYISNPNYLRMVLQFIKKQYLILLKEI